MIVTGIEELTKSRSRIFLDGEFAFVLYRGELRRFHLREGEAIKEKDYATIMEEILPKRAKLRAMNLLQKKDYTTAKLRKKLAEGGYPEKITEEALAYVASYHYTDDLRYAKEFIRCHQEKRTRMRMEQDLHARGLDSETIEKAFLEWEEEGGSQDEADMIKDLFRKRGFDPENASMEERKKEYGFLMRRGFSADSVREALCLRS